LKQTIEEEEKPYVSCTWVQKS